MQALGCGRHTDHLSLWFLNLFLDNPALCGEKLRQIGHGLFGVPSSHLFVLRLINFDTGDRHVSRRMRGDLPFVFTKLLTGGGLD